MFKIKIESHVVRFLKKLGKKREIIFMSDLKSLVMIKQDIGCWTFQRT